MSSEPIIGQPLTFHGARKLAASIARERALGRDPVADFNSAKRIRNTEREDRAERAFPILAGRFIEEHARPKTRSWATSARLLGLQPETLEPVKGGLGERWRDKSVDEISADDVHHLIDEIRKRGIPGLVRRNSGESDSVARVSHARLSKFFAWLMERRLITANPCTGIWRPNAGPARERVLTDDEVRWFWLACRGQLGEPFEQVFKVLLLTGQRRDEVAGMRWTELSEDRTAWSLPGERTKNKKSHVVPLSRAARDLIATVHKIGDGFVFTTTGESAVSGWSKTKRRLDARIAELAGCAALPWTIHDLRRTVATNLQNLEVRLEVTEAVLNHVSGSRGGIVGVYQRYAYDAEKREALDRWAAHIERITSSP